jgi:hypothetical protein
METASFRIWWSVPFHKSLLLVHVMSQMSPVQLRSFALLSSYLWDGIRKFLDCYCGNLTQACCISLLPDTVLWTCIVFMWVLIQLHVSVCLCWMAELSNGPASSFVWSLVNLLPKTLGLRGFRRTFFKPDSCFWMVFTFQGHTYALTHALLCTPMCVCGVGLTTGACTSTFSDLLCV